MTKQAKNKQHGKTTPKSILQTVIYIIVASSIILAGLYLIDIIQKVVK